MDEAWQVPIGSILPSRRSAEEPRPRHRHRRLLARGGGAASSAALDPDDFRDVFGGPPRTVLLRRFSGELRPPPSTSLYDEIFRPAAERRGGGPRRIPGEGGGGGEWGRRLPGFRIPERGGMLRTEEGFYDDIFGSDGRGFGGGEWRRRRSRSRSKRSSAVSSDEVSPPPPPPAATAAAAPGADDAVLSFFASKLRPITIPSRRRHDSSPPSTISVGDQSSVRSFAIPFMNLRDNNYTANISSSNISQQLRSNSVTFRCFSPPETIRGTPWGGNSELDSPPSAISSVSVDPIVPSKSTAMEIEKVVVMEIDSEEDSNNNNSVESSFVIEIDAHGRRKEATEVDEAIAWAKETFWNEMHKKVEAKETFWNEMHKKVEVKNENFLELKDSEEESSVVREHSLHA